MSGTPTPFRLVAFFAALAVVFGVAAAAGSAIDPDRETAAEAPGDGGHAMGEEAGGADHPVRGLGVAEDGLRLVVADPELARGRAATLAFRVVDERGATVRDFDVAHTKRMHVIVVRRDLTGFQHLHPTLRADGTWATPLKLSAAGSYRLFADFERGGDKHTLASDLSVDGAADLQPLPAPASTARSDGGYDVTVTRDGDLQRFAISRDGVPVQPEEYLGAAGHLVALREGDLAFLHVHPTSDARAEFEVTLPTAGRYRLFLQFQHEGRVQTVAFTQEVS
jgi:hypothetical protein